MSNHFDFSKTENKSCHKKQRSKFTYMAAFLVVLFLTILLLFVSNVTNIPSSIMLIQGEKLSFENLWGIEMSVKGTPYKTMQTSAVLEDVSTIGANNTGETNLVVSLFGKIPLKNVTVEVIPKTTVIPARKQHRNKTLYKWCISCRNDRNIRNKTISKIRNKRRRYDCRNKRGYNHLYNRFNSQCE